jgi:hypothetical protein
MSCARTAEDPDNTVPGRFVQFVRVEARLGPHANIAFEGLRPDGYFQRLGVTAKDKEHLAQIVREFVERDTGAIVIRMDDFASPDFDHIDKDIKDTCGNISECGVWYSSGRAFFTETDPSAPPPRWP